MVRLDHADEDVLQHEVEGERRRGVHSKDLILALAGRIGTAGAVGHAPIVGRPTLIRKALVDSGRYKSYADLKGLKFALLGQGGSPSSTLNEALKRGGLGWDDVEKVYIGFPQQIAAFKNAAIDGSIMIEPFATAIVASGDAVRFVSTEDFFPHNQIGMVFFSEKFIKERRGVGLRFLKAYVRALRDYNDA